MIGQGFGLFSKLWNSCGLKQITKTRWPERHQPIARSIIRADEFTLLCSLQFFADCTRCGVS